MCYKDYVPGTLFIIGQMPCPEGLPCGDKIVVVKADTQLYRESGIGILPIPSYLNTAIVTNYKSYHFDGVKSCTPDPLSSAFYLLL